MINHKGPTIILTVRAAHERMPPAAAFPCVLSDRLCTRTPIDWLQPHSAPSRGHQRVALVPTDRPPRRSSASSRRRPCPARAPGSTADSCRAMVCRVVRAPHSPHRWRRADRWSTEWRRRRHTGRGREAVQKCREGGCVVDSIWKAGGKTLQIISCSD